MYPLLKDVLKLSAYAVIFSLFGLGLIEIFDTIIIGPWFQGGLSTQELLLYAIILPICIIVLFPFYMLIDWMEALLVSGVKMAGGRILHAILFIVLLTLTLTVSKDRGLAHSVLLVLVVLLLKMAAKWVAGALSAKLALKGKQ